MSREAPKAMGADVWLEAVSIPSPSEADAGLAAAVARIGPLDETAMALAAAGLDRLTKPPGSLGRLEGIAIDLAGHHRPSRPGGRPAGDRRRRGRPRRGAPGRIGLSVRGHDPDGRQLRRGRRGDRRPRCGFGARLVVLDVGVAGPIPDAPSRRRAPTCLGRRIRAGTADMSAGPAMTRDEASAGHRAWGWRSPTSWSADGIELLGVGEMGIGNTTAASAVVAAMTGAAPAPVTGRGTGLDDAGRARKVATIERALRRHALRPDDPVGVLRRRRRARDRRPCRRASSARRRPASRSSSTGSSPARRPCWQRPSRPARHRGCSPAIGRWSPATPSSSTGSGCDPLLDLDLRLGEGTGAALAMGLIDAAVRIRDGMATFEDRPPCPARADMASPTVALVRHASTAWSGHRYCGRADPPLTPRDGSQRRMPPTELARHHRHRRSHRVEPASPGARDRARSIAARDRCVDRPRPALAGGGRRGGRGPDVRRHRDALAEPRPPVWRTARRPSTGPTARALSTSTDGSRPPGRPSPTTSDRRSSSPMPVRCASRCRSPRIAPRRSCGSRSRHRSCWVPGPRPGPVARGEQPALLGS